MVIKMPRYIDADSLCEEIETMSIFLCGKDIFPKEAKDTVLDTIANAPTEDVVPVVRCKDCEHSKCRTTQNGRFLTCNIFSDALILPNGFCSFGKRREYGKDD